MLAYEDIAGYLHYYANRFEDYQFEHWELVNEAWIVVHKLNHIKFASQGIRWAMITYKAKELRHRRFGCPKAKIVSLETPTVFGRMLQDMISDPKRYSTMVDDIDVINGLADEAQLSLDQRLLLDQRYWKCMCLQEIAMTRRCTRENVRLLLNRILRKLQSAARRLERWDNIVLAG